LLKQPLDEDYQLIFRRVTPTIPQNSRQDGTSGGESLSRTISDDAVLPHGGGIK
jgi:hypothetical protein